ncbi:MAG: type VI secretion system baseplate subunit TssG [Gammaproteobacteria bacterium]|nr:type VI secretion system baseplate subunit TssG [Gammaproteobacteria bacterium]
MSTSSRRKNTSVIKKLVDSPESFSFLQAVRLIERFNALHNVASINIAKNPVARFLPPTTEVVRFHSRQSLAFQSAEITSLESSQNTAALKQWHMVINFMGLTGSSGIMPYHYSELVLQRLKVKDRSMESFFDLFNHRTVSLFFQASLKYNLALEYERRKLNPVPGIEPDNHTKLLLSLIGLGTKGLTKRLYTMDESLLYYAGLFTQKVRTSQGLKQIIQQHFNIPVQIQEFIGQWQELINDVRTMLPGIANPRGQNNSLGKSVMLGRKGWFAQGKFRIILGPLSRAQLGSFAPGTATLNALNEIVRLYINFEYAYDFVMRIERGHIPARIMLSRAAAPIMGWNTWLSNRPAQPSAETAMLDIPVSSSRLK